MSISGVNCTKGLRLAIDVREETDYRRCPLDWAWFICTNGFSNRQLSVSVYNIILLLLLPLPAWVESAVQQHTWHWIAL